MRLPLASTPAPARRAAVAAVTVLALLGGAVATTASPLASGPSLEAIPVLAAAPVPAEEPLAPATAEIPPEVLATYRAAALRHGLPWPVLAALGRAATAHGARSPDDAVVRTAVWPSPVPAITGPAGVGPLLIDPTRVPDVDPARLQSWPVAVELVAAQLDAAMDVVVQQHGTTRAELAAARDLAVVAPLWAEGLAQLTIAPTGGLCEARPQETGGPLVRALLSCGLGAADVQVVTAGGLVTGAAGRALLTTEALDLAWRWSRSGALPCDPDAPVAGVFPVPASAGIDRCDPVANVTWTVGTVTAAELVPVAERSDANGGWVGVVSGLLDPDLPLDPGRLTPGGLLGDPEPMGAAPTFDTRFSRRVLEQAARYAGGTLPLDTDVVGAAQAGGATRASSWRALDAWRTVRLHHPDCVVGLGPVVTLALAAPVLPEGWTAVRDGDLDGTIDPADRDDRLASVADGMCTRTTGWTDPAAQATVAAAAIADPAPAEGSPASLALAGATAIDAVVAPALVAAILPDPAVGPIFTPAARPQLPGATDDPGAREVPPEAAPIVSTPDAELDADVPLVDPTPTGQTETTAPPLSAAVVPGAKAAAGVVDPEPTTTVPPDASEVTGPTEGGSPDATDDLPPVEEPEPAVDALQAALARVAQMTTPVELRTVRGIRVAANLAPAFEAMLAAAEADGVVLSGGGYRTTASQVELRAAHCGDSDYGIWRRPSGECSPPTATPGASRHETGEAVDFLRCGTRATDCYQWLAVHAAGYGFHNQPQEAWHWSIDGR